MPQFQLNPSPPGGNLNYNGTIVLPPPTVPPDCPPAPPCPPGGPCSSNEIRGATLYGSQCCIYHFHLSCALAPIYDTTGDSPVLVTPGTMGYWNVAYIIADVDNPPLFNFFFWDQPPATDDGVDPSGFVPDYQSQDLPVGAPDATFGYAESCYLEIIDLSGGFTTLQVTAQVYDPTSQTVITDPDNPLLIDLSAYVSCSNGVSAATSNSADNSQGGAFTQEDCTYDPTNVFTNFVHGTNCWVYKGYLDCALFGDVVGGHIADGSLNSVTILSGTVQYAGEADPFDCDSGCCFGDRTGCTPSVPPDQVVEEWVLPGPVGMTPGANPGEWFVAASDIGFDGTHTTAEAVGVFQLQTNLGNCTWIVAHSVCY